MIISNNFLQHREYLQISLFISIIHSLGFLILQDSSAIFTSILSLSSFILFSTYFVYTTVRTYKKIEYKLFFISYDIRSFIAYNFLCIAFLLTTLVLAVLFPSIFSIPIVSSLLLLLSLNYLYCLNEIQNELPTVDIVYRYNHRTSFADSFYLSQLCFNLVTTRQEEKVVIDMVIEAFKYQLFSKSASIYDYTQKFIFWIEYRNLSEHTVLQLIRNLDIFYSHKLIPSQRIKILTHLSTIKLLSHSLDVRLSKAWQYGASRLTAQKKSQFIQEIALIMFHNPKFKYVSILKTNIISELKYEALFIHWFIYVINQKNRLDQNLILEHLLQQKPSSFDQEFWNWISTKQNFTDWIINRVQFQPTDLEMNLKGMSFNKSTLSFYYEVIRKVVFKGGLSESTININLHFLYQIQTTIPRYSKKWAYLSDWIVLWSSLKNYNTSVVIGNMIK